MKFSAVWSDGVAGQRNRLRNVGHGDGPVRRMPIPASLERAIDLGCNFFDTAGLRRRSQRELLGKALRANRGRNVCSDKIAAKNRQWPSRRAFTLDESYPPDYVFEYVEKVCATSARTRSDLIHTTLGRSMA